VTVDGVPALLVSVTDHLLLVAESAELLGLSAAQRERLSGSGSIDEFVGGLLEPAMPRLSSFAAIFVDASPVVRILVRGQLVCELSGREGERSLVGAADVATWREDTVADPRSLRVVHTPTGTVAVERRWSSSVADGTAPLDAASSDDAPAAALAPTAAGRDPGPSPEVMDADRDAVSPMPATGRGLAALVELLDAGASAGTSEEVLDASVTPDSEVLTGRASGPETRNERSEGTEGVLDDAEPEAPAPALDDRAASSLIEHTLAPPSDDGAEDFDFSHLIDETQYRDVEAAAVRDDEIPSELDPEAEVEPAESDPFGPGVDRDPGVDDAAVAVATHPPPPGPGSVPALPSLPTPPPVLPDPPIAAPGLIDSVPVRSNERASQPTAPAPSAAPAADLDAPSPERPGDHDGHTVPSSELRRIRAESRSGGEQSGARTTFTGPTVQAVRCPESHVNPPHAPACRVCGRDIVDRDIQVIPRPALGVLRFLGGSTVSLDRPQLIGRKPTVDRDHLGPTGPELAGLVTIPDPEQALSRVHAAVTFEGWEVLVTDRGSKNGTQVVVPGEAPVLLRANEPMIIVPGTRLYFADVAEAVFEVGGG
jgi:hypothetical protein